MKFCKVCGAHCDDSAELCLVCGAEFIDDEQETAEEIDENIITINNPVLAASVEDIITTEIYCDVLADNDIPYSFDEENSEAGIKIMMGGSFAATNIYVDEKDLEKAEALYQEVLNSNTEFDGEFEDFEDFEEEPQDI